VTLPIGVTSIGDYAFLQCGSLTSVIIPNSVLTIGSQSFAYCSSLKNITLSTTIISFGGLVLYNSNSITDIYINCLDGETYGKSSYIYRTLNIPAYSGKIRTQVPDSTINYINANFNTPNIFITSNPIKAFEGTTIQINSYTDISRYIYTYYSYSSGINNLNAITDLTSKQCVLLINMPEITGVTGITDDLCNGFSSLFSVIIPNNVTTIGARAFNQCSILKFVIIPNSVTSIGANAFNLCVSLLAITIPNKSIAINSYAFTNCSQLTQIRVLVQQSSDTIQPIFTGLRFLGTPTPSVTKIVKSSPPTVTSALYNYAFNRITLQYTPGSVDTGDAIQFFEYRINSLDWKIVPQNNIISYGTYKTTDTIQLRQYTQSAGYSDPTAAFNIIVDIPCFKKDTKILTNKGYRRIQAIRKGDMVFTYKHGFKAVHAIGYSNLHHHSISDKIKNQLYRCSRSQYPELFEDLIITGCHSILIPEFTSQEQTDKTIQVLGKIYVTDGLYRIPACVDDRTAVYETPGEYTIYHLALENDDYYSNYGIYANGLLVETCSKRYLKELSNMTLIK
jgi:hypothetical protein